MIVEREKKEGNRGRRIVRRKLSVGRVVGGDSLPGLERAQRASEGL